LEKLELKTFNFTDENIQKLSELFPNCVTEGGKGKIIDFDLLKQELTNYIVEGNKERYQLTWPGKNEAVLNANVAINKTLRPNSEESKDFDNTKNLYIEGDNLEVLKLLQETYLGKVKLIYIDPPYNTGRNLIYKNDFSESNEEFLAKSNQISADAERLVTNPETNGRFHSDWLSMIYPRLILAKKLLSNDGVLVCSIDENEQASLLLILKEIFCETSYDHVCMSIVHNPRGIQGINFSYTHEYAIFVIPKNIPEIINNQSIDDTEVEWTPFRNWGGESERKDAKNCFYPIIVKNNTIVGAGKVCPDDFHPKKQTEIHGDEFYVYPIDKNGVERKWRYAEQSFSKISEQLIAEKVGENYQIKIGKTSKKIKTVWMNKKYDASTHGTQLVNSLIEDSGFTFPKSIWTVYDTIAACTKNDKEHIVLDFFSGSATTAHAVLQINADDTGNRKFIMVQIAEQIDQNENIYSSGYKTIAEIGKERIRRAGEKIKEDNIDKEGIEDLDIGFRAFKVDSSNMKDVYFNPDETNQTNILDLASNIKDGRTDEDLLFMVLLSWGIDLSAKIEKKEIAGKDVYFVDDNYLAACFDKHIDENFIKALLHEKPLKVILQDSSFASDSIKINVEQIFVQANIEGKVI
jgi:adenine-specific DNA-methyltransferase